MLGRSSSLPSSFDGDRREHAEGSHRVQGYLQGPVEGRGDEKTKRRRRIFNLKCIATFAYSFENAFSQYPSIRESENPSIQYPPNPPPLCGARIKDDQHRKGRKIWAEVAAAEYKAYLLVKEEAKAARMLLHRQDSEKADEKQKMMEAAISREARRSQPIDSAEQWEYSLLLVLETLKKIKNHVRKLNIWRARSRLYRSRFLKVNLQHLLNSTRFLRTFAPLQFIVCICEFLLTRFTFSHFFVVWVVPGFFPHCIPFGFQLLHRSKLQTFANTDNLFANFLVNICPD